MGFALPIVLSRRRGRGRRCRNRTPRTGGVLALLVHCAPRVCRFPTLEVSRIRQLWRSRIRRRRLCHERRHQQQRQQQKLHRRRPFSSNPLSFRTHNERYGMGSVESEFGRSLRLSIEIRMSSSQRILGYKTFGRDWLSGDIGEGSISTKK